MVISSFTKVPRRYLTAISFSLWANCNYASYSAKHKYITLHLTYSPLYMIFSTELQLFHTYAMTGMLAADREKG